MTKTEILSNIGVGSESTQLNLLKLLLTLTLPLKKNLDNLEEKTKDKISTFGVLKVIYRILKISKIFRLNKNLYWKLIRCDCGNTNCYWELSSSDINSSLTVTTLATSHTLTGPTSFLYSW